VIEAGNYLVDLYYKGKKESFASFFFLDYFIAIFIVKYKK
jgi:hypothetical protein